MRPVDTIRADLDALRGVIASGTRKVRYADGRDLTYSTIADLERALARVESELAQAENLAAAPRLTFVEHSRF